MMPKPPDAFWSYTHSDNQHEGEAITKLRQRVEREVGAITGEPFVIFQDIEGVGLGEHWHDKLDKMLEEARFLIPIVTPSYFKSRACRDELEKFLEAERKRGRNDLVLPISYIECPILEEADRRAADPLATAIYRRQWFPWRELRHRPLSTPKVKMEITRLARAIAKARCRAKPPAPLEPPVNSTGASTATSQEDRPKPGGGRRKQRARKRQNETSVHDAPPPGTVFTDIDAPWCPEMVVIPPGGFRMGEKREHLVEIAYSFAVGQYPITFQEYDHFAAATRRSLPHDHGWGRGRRPVIYVSWDDAQAYVEWLSGETGQSYRLLSEAEWEYACRAGSTTRYSWGDEITRENANYRGIWMNMTREVGCYPPNAFGLSDMHGNVWEWCADPCRAPYQGTPTDGSTWTDKRVIRGGSWIDGRSRLVASFRTCAPACRGSYALGFRVARDLT